jgi:hypothetical protein
MMQLNFYGDSRMLWKRAILCLLVWMQPTIQRKLVSLLICTQGYRSLHNTSAMLITVCSDDQLLILIFISGNTDLQFNADHLGVTHKYVHFVSSNIIFALTQTEY